MCHPDKNEYGDTLIGRIQRYLYEKGEYNPESENSFKPALANRIWIMRKFLADMNSIEAMELLQDKMNRWGSNEALLQNMDKDEY